MKIGLLPYQRFLLLGFESFISLNIKAVEAVYMSTEENIQQPYENNHLSLKIQVECKRS